MGTTNRCVILQEIVCHHLWVCVFISCVWTFSLVCEPYLLCVNLIPCVWSLVRTKFDVTNVVIPLVYLTQLRSTQGIYHTQTGTIHQYQNALDNQICMRRGILTIRAFGNCPVHPSRNKNIAAPWPQKHLTLPGHNKLFSSTLHLL